MCFFASLLLVLKTAELFFFFFLFTQRLAFKEFPPFLSLVPAINISYKYHALFVCFCLANVHFLVCTFIQLNTTDRLPSSHCLLNSIPDHTLIFSSFFHNTCMAPKGKSIWPNNLPIMMKFWHCTSLALSFVENFKSQCYTGYTFWTLYRTK